MMIRFFADVDQPTATSSFALALCDALVVVGASEGCPVRLVPSEMVGALCTDEGAPTSTWTRHQQLLITPIAPKFVNVVCTKARWWAPFWTKGARNVLAIAAGVQEIQTAHRYDEIIVPNVELAMAYRRSGESPPPGDPYRTATVPDRMPIVIDKGSRLSALRDAIFGAAA